MAHTLSLAQVVDSDNSEVGFAVVMVTRVMSSSGHVPIVRGVQHQLQCLQSWSCVYGYAHAYVYTCIQYDSHPTHSYDRYLLLSA